jgi:hypothetical protein
MLEEKFSYEGNKEKLIGMINSSKYFLYWTVIQFQFSESEVNTPPSSFKTANNARVH